MKNSTFAGEWQDSSGFTARVSYLFLSFLAGILELSPIVLLISTNASVSQIILAGCCYQLGNLAASTLRLSKLLVIIMLSIATICALAAYRNLAMFYVASVLTSSALQQLRRLIVAINVGSKISTFQKRFVRILGFSLAGLVSFTSYPLLVLTVWVFAVILLLWRRENWQAYQQTHYPHPSKLAKIMLVHQSHYFSYAYLIPVIFHLYLGFSVEYAGLLFVIGWVSYILSESLFHSYNLRWTFIFGHILVSLALIAIALFSNHSLIVLLAWFASGLGGGTVFCITKMNKFAQKDRVEMDIWEDIGHVVGVLITLGALAIFYALNPINLFWLSAMIALIAAFMMYGYTNVQSSDEPIEQTI